MSKPTSRSSHAITAGEGMVVYVDGKPVHQIPVDQFPRTIELMARKLNEATDYEKL